MTRHELMALAKDAGLPTAWISDSGVLIWTDLERFAALVAAHEREECAKLAGDFAVDLDDVWVCEKLADAIRSRSN